MTTYGLLESGHKHTGEIVKEAIMLEPEISGLDKQTLRWVAFMLQAGGDHLPNWLESQLK